MKEKSRACINYANTWTYVSDEENRIRTEKFPVLNDLEEQWDILSSHDISERYKGRDYFKTPIQAFSEYIDSGMYPPPEILLSVMQSFSVYFSLAGKASLEEVFFGKPKRGVGGFAAQAHRVEPYRTFSFNVTLARIAAERRGEKNPSLEEIAEQYQDKSIVLKWLCDEGKVKHEDIYDSEFDVDSFLRGYRRWRLQQKASPSPDN